MPFLDIMDSTTGFVDPKLSRDKGRELAGAYNAASPFPSIVIDDFLPAPLAERLLASFVARSAAGGTESSFDRPQERLKNSYHPDTLDDFGRTVFYAFNSRPFIRLIENVTGIAGLIPDPYFLGAGFHEIENGGHLSVHADFNHHRPMNLERRINILIYLNHDWHDAYGGQLEFWTTDMAARTASVLPVFNRAVIFNTTSTSMHGNPQPVNHPDGVSRKSIALYYYTSTWGTDKSSLNTNFKVRPGSADRTDWATRLRKARNEILPPIVDRNVDRALRRLWPARTGR